ncbi:MAG TPA: hypothetical protein VG270_01930, partial [Pseudolabrys sp.]|nr:hypothetical protein [Pseudolabrys sp.]
MSTYDPNSPRRPAGGNGSGGWIIGIIVIVLIALGVWWYAGTNGTGPQTANNNPPATTTGTAPATTGSAPPAT